MCYNDFMEDLLRTMINPPRNRETGFPHVGRGVADPNARLAIEAVVIYGFYKTNMV